MAGGVICHVAIALTGISNCKFSSPLVTKQHREKYSLLRVHGSNVVMFSVYLYSLQ